MLQEISIENFAIIDNLSTEFSSGLTVLTGETGAGKSIIIDAVGLLVGGRAQTEMIRTGSEQAIVQGRFVLSKDHPVKKILLDNNIESDNELIIYRQINRSGANNIRINHQLATLKLLTEIGNLLVDIHGQFDHQQLLDDEQHIYVLDQFANDLIAKPLIEYQEKFKEFQKIRAALINKQKNQQELAQRIDLLQFQKRELDEANLTSGEEQQLLADLEIANNFAKISEALSNANNALNGEDNIGALDGLSAAMSEVSSIEKLDSKYQEISDTLSSAYYGAQEASRDLGNLISDLSFDEESYDQINQRVLKINDLKRKYGPTFDDVIKHHQTVTEELDSMGENTLDEEQLKEHLKTATQELKLLSDKLTKIRHEQGNQLAQLINQQFADMLMEKAHIFVHVNKADKFTSLGQDEVIFYIRTNPGEDPKPLSKIASGGELSRVMLSIKTILANSSVAQTVIFDEVDTGVSGRVAQKIGEKERLIGQSLQVLSITHLPQVAAAADQQYLIEKQVVDGRTTTRLTKVAGEDRIQAIAVMLSGDSVTPKAIENAHELLDTNQRGY